MLNEVPGGPALRAYGPLKLNGPDSGNHSIVFSPQGRGQLLLLDGGCTLEQDRGYALEFSCLSESIRGMALASLIAHDENPVERHFALLQLTGRPRDCMHQPAFAVCWTAARPARTAA